jgi:Meiotically up-regulated gene 113
MPGYVKVGCTDRTGEIRADELYTTGVPLPYKVEFRAVTSHPANVEKEAHRLLDAHRPNPKREFFTVSAEEATKAVREALQAANGIKSWESGEINRLKPGDRCAITCREGELFILMAYKHLWSEHPDPVDIWQAPSDGDIVEFMATEQAGHVAGFATGDPGGELDPVPYLDRTRAVPNITMIGRERLVPGDRVLWLGDPTQTGWAGCVTFEASAYIQVVCRTWQPKVVEFDGVARPVLFNDADLGSLPAHLYNAALRAGQAALRLPRPRSWAPRDRDPEDGWEIVADNPPDPDFWLPQLNESRYRRSRRRSTPR